MRRALIFLMLGIIMFSTLSSLISPWPESDDKIMLLDTVYSVVSAGNFTYWNFGQNGPLFIELTSVIGDADLFVGDHMRPSYEADRNNFSSETCGIDSVFIPRDFPRPIVIAVFGQWGHSLTKYFMKVYMDVTMLQSSQEGRPSFITQPRMVHDMSRYTAKVPEKETVQFGFTTINEDEKPKFIQLFKALDTMFGLLT